MDKSISEDDVAHVASLARLELTQEQLVRFTGQMRKLLESVAVINSLDLTEHEPMAQPYPLRNVFRADEIAPCLDRDEVLSQAPEAKDSRFRVPPALGDSP